RGAQRVGLRPPRGGVRGGDVPGRAARRRTRLRARPDGRAPDPQLEPCGLRAPRFPGRAARGRRDGRERIAVAMAWRVPIVDLAAESLEVGPAVESAVLRVLRSQQFILGPETAGFEAELGGGGRRWLAVV